ncbi:NnrU family protein [Pelagibacterium limicola]|uniref:NnrU family protein n=1 Tax=Pelagibacterium limicola TaxID=2791022 RepID=UPI0018B01122|nr:NnrU family protein [Pelagibacterium limicola]
MTHVVLALSVFLLTHLVTALPGVRDVLVIRLGLPSYIVIYSAISILALTWLILATLEAPVTLLWYPSGWQAWVTIIVSPVAVFLIVAGLLSPNPMSLSFFPDSRRQTGAIVEVTRHPVFWGAFLWAGGHIPPNGDMRSVLLFGVLALLALAGFVLGDRRSRRRLGSRWPKVAETTSIIPFLAIIQGRARLRFDLPLLAAMAVASVLTGWMLLGGHAFLFGADPLAATRY